MSKAIMDRTAVYCPNARDEVRVIELRRRFGAHSYSCCGKRHTGHSDFAVKVSKPYLDYNKLQHYLRRGYSLISVTEYERMLGKPPQKPVLETPIKPLKHVLASKWVLQHKLYSMTLRKGGVKGTSTWDGEGCRSHIRGLAVACMKALEMEHEDIERMLKECNEVVKPEVPKLLGGTPKVLTFKVRKNKS